LGGRSDRSSENDEPPKLEIAEEDFPWEKLKTERGNHGEGKICSSQYQSEGV